MSAKMIRGFIGFTPEALRAYRKEAGFAMSEADFTFVQAHFAEELRDPTDAELRVIDAFWSEQVRHGTLLTRISKMEIHKSSIPAVQKAFESYLALFNMHHKGRADKFPTLADLAAIAAHDLTLRGASTGVYGGGIRVEPVTPDKAEGWLVIPEIVSAGEAERVFAYQCICASFVVAEKGKQQRTESVCSLSAVPQKAFKTEQAAAGDVVLLLKGADEAMRKLLLRPEFVKLLKRRSFVAAGGLAVAVGNLASGVDIMLDAVAPEEGAETASELALIAAQGYTVALVHKKFAKKAAAYAMEGGVRAVELGEATEKGRLRMYRDGNLIADLPRLFLETNGAAKSAPAVLKEKRTDYFTRVDKSVAAAVRKGDSAALKGILCGSRKAAVVPVSVEQLSFADRKTAPKTVCACGFDPILCAESPYLGGMYAIVEAVARCVIAGVPLASVYLTAHGFFTQPDRSAEAFGKAVSGLLGAFSAELGLGLGKIGLRDSISADMRQRLVVFGVGVELQGGRIAERFSRAGQRVYRYRLRRDAYGVIDFVQTKEFLNLLNGEALRGLVDFAAVGAYDGAAFSVAEGCKGTGFGFRFASDPRALFAAANGDIIFSTERPDDYIGYELEYVGQVTDGGTFAFFEGSI